MVASRNALSAHSPQAREPVGEVIYNILDARGPTRHSQTRKKENEQMTENLHDSLAFYIDQVEKHDTAGYLARSMQEELAEYDAWQAKLTWGNETARQSAKYWLTFGQGKDIVQGFQGYVRSILPTMRFHDSTMRSMLSLDEK
jgi:hypothetical protein